jgi:hypothetical protein
VAKQLEKTGYEVNGEVVTTLKEVAEQLGVGEVKGKDVQEGGKYADQVNLVDLTDDEWEDGYPQKNAKASGNEKHPMEEEEIDPDKIFTTLSDEDVETLEDVKPEDIEGSMPDFETLDELKDIIKDIDTHTLEYMATALGLEWNPTYHKNIHRMRVAMAMHKHYFPELFKPKESKKKNAKYGDFDTDTLYSMLKEEGLSVKRTGNEAIDRMRAITELKQAGQLQD